MTSRVGVLTVGAGAAGLMAAITAARLGATVVLLEGGRKPGAKILASGGSRCNLTHREVFPEDYSGGSRRVVARLLRELDAAAARQFFEDLGVATKIEDTGKVFPVSDSAVTVRDALVREAGRTGVEIRCEARVAALEPGSGAWRVRLESGEALEGARVILATGGLSYPSTGSRGDGLAWATSLGHTVVPTIPALTPLLTNDSLAHALSGVTLEAALTLRAGEGGRSLYDFAGSFLFTHTGCSGPAALNLSRHYLRARTAGPAWGEANFLPGHTREQADARLQELRAAEPRRAVGNALALLVPRRLAEAILARAEVTESTALAELTREARSRIVRLLTAWPLALTGTAGYDRAEVTAGGVELSEVNPASLESRLAPGLHLCGEVLDVDGRLGGYNFQWAWSSGFVAGRGAARGAQSA